MSGTRAKSRPTPPAILPLDLPTDPLIAAIADRIVDKLFGSEQLVEKLAETISLRFELLEPEAAAAMLGKTERTLRDNHVAWGLDKSTAFGATNPKYFLTQIIERAKARVIAGRKPEAA